LPLVDDADLWRAHVYALLGKLLARAPDAALLGRLADLDGHDPTPLGRVFGQLGEAARATSPHGAEREYAALFVGVTRGELVPYASYYLTGFLNERPLATLRGDMLRFRIERAEGSADPEDHIASLCEMMAGLIGGAFGEPAGLAEQQRFFERHLAPWAPRFFTDLEAAEAAYLYRPVGQAGALFMSIEASAFAMAA